MYAIYSAERPTKITPIDSARCSPSCSQSFRTHWSLSLDSLFDCSLNLPVLKTEKRPHEFLLNIPKYPLFFASVLSNNAYFWKLIGCAQNQNETLVKRRTAPESPRKTAGWIMKSASVFLTVQPWKTVYLTYTSFLGAKNMFYHNSKHKRQG